MTQKYDKEYKINAVKLYIANNKSIEKMASDLGISRTSLGHWISKYKQKGEGCFVGSGHSVPDEVTLLKKELRLVKRERDILKRVVAIFSTPAGKGTNS